MRASMGWNRLRSNGSVSYTHLALAEAHHFIIALALGVEVGASLAAAHGQGLSLIHI